ncbi:MAG: hypothetical protein A2286_07915 [Gammaproteobacteria bacterium RIFOXYA12_FULL_61_12]|nr:MAG: hypothetical protein A2514_14200 [Gammaproteobacteria bacterium RIFOXYD12_FULL_61_37]OGT92408.1 MAG: hypothetical protein A2286_07915 [Gammaproteobacteria bacterium RIFOXYA12_FULL_61_12]
MQQFYEKRLYRPLWLAEGKPTEIAKSLVNRLMTAADAGLPNIDLRPHLEPLNSGGNDQQQAAFELALTEGVTQYARSLSVGRYEPAMVDAGWYMPARTFNASEFLKNLVTSPDATQLINSLEPQVEEYRKLKQALKRYRELAAKGGWLMLPQAAIRLKPGVKSDMVPLLRQRLMAQEEFPSSEPMNSTRYDPALAQAMRAFQERHGLKNDGVIGTGTIAVLNVPVEQRIQSIIATLERWRWMPRDLGIRHVLVNLPEFGLQLFDQGQVVWRTRIINGEKKHPSPSISAEIIQVKANPEWFVPNKIAIKEMIPELQKNPDYLRDNGYKLYLREGRVEVNPRSVNWNEPFTIRGFPYLIKQDLGDDNALGRVKMVMPNRQAIYLHDTPYKTLFDKEVRTLSHGCIRVQNPETLAGYLLDKVDPEQGKRRVLQEMNQGITVDIDLPEKVPVYLAYFTARADASGEVRFLQDIYGRDKLFDQN